jgi:hypothetical protein
MRGHVLSEGFQHLASDAAGDEGIVNARLTLWPDIPADIGADVGVAQGVDLYLLDEDYSQWDKYRDLRVQTFCRLVESPPGEARPEGVRLRIYSTPDGDEVSLVVLLQRAKTLGSVGYGAARWRDGRFSEFSICDFDPGRHTLEDLRLAWRSLRALANMKEGPGRRSDSPAEELNELVRAAERIRAAPRNERITRGRLARELFLSATGVDKKLQRAGVKNLGGLLSHMGIYYK